MLNRLSDVTILVFALKNYQKLVEGWPDDYCKEQTIKRIKELRKKPIVANSIAMTIKLDAPDVQAKVDLLGLEEKHI